MKKIKLISILSTASLATLSSISIGLMLKTNNSIINNYDNVNLHAIGDTSSTQTTASWKYTNDTIKTWDWYGKLRPEQVNEEQIKSLITFTHYDAIINIEIQEVQQKHITNGYIEFKVMQTINEYKDGIPSSSKTVAINPPTGSGSNGIWSTQSFTGLFIPDKYSFQWRSVDEISQFLEATDKNYDTLTIQDVLLNMVERGENFKLPEKATLTKSALTSNLSNDRKYGSVKITIVFPDATNSTDWVNSVVPDATKLTYEIRGLKSTDTQNDVDTTMDFIEKTNYEVQSLSINTSDKTNPLNKYLADANQNQLSGTLSDLFPSELVNFGGTDDNALLSLLTQGLYLSPTTANNDNKVAKLMYYGQNIDSNNFANITGLDNNEISNIGINNVSGVADDSKGSLKLVYEYSKYDVYTNSIVKEEKSTTYPEGTFKVNPDANKTLQFSWKDDSALVGVSSSYKVVNDFNSNKSNNDYIKTLSNQFIDASYDVYSKDRKVDISFGNGQTISNGVVTPTTQNDTTVKVSLTFDSWSGERYLDDNGMFREGFKTEKIFTLKNYNNTIAGVTWKTQDEVKQALGDISKMSVIEIADKLFSKEIPLSTFVTGADNKSVIYNVTPSTGTINISIEDGNNVESNVYSGFLNEGVNNVTQFSWIPISDVSPILLATNLNEITKELVINEYLSKIPAFSNETINPDDVNITPNLENKTLIVEVNLAKYDQETTTANRNFKIELKGFIDTSITNGNSYVAPVDLTIILSVVLGLVVSIVLITILVIILIKRAKLKMQKSKQKSK